MTWTWIGIAGLVLIAAAAFLWGGLPLGLLVTGVLMVASAVDGRR